MKRWLHSMVYSHCLLCYWCYCILSLAKKYNELFPKQKKEKKEDKKPKEQKKQEPKKEPKKKEPEPDEEEDDAPKPPKFVDPYADLPKRFVPAVINYSYLIHYVSSFDMDEFKRTYSNKDTATVAIPYFWEHFDKEGWSIWRADYAYNDELNMVFMACNLISGMFQRLEKLNKTAFASVCIYGVDKNAAIAGVWVFRGQELAFNVSYCKFVLLHVQFSYVYS